MLQYEIIRKRVRCARIIIDGEKVILICPERMKNPNLLIEKRKPWILKKLKQVSDLKKEVLEKIDIQELEYNIKKASSNIKEFKNKFKNRLINIINEYKNDISADYNNISIRHQKTKWACVTSGKNIIFNIRLAFVPERVLRYIVYHELIHFKIRNHKAKFKNRLRSKFTDYKELEKILKMYSFTFNNMNMVPGLNK